MKKGLDENTYVDEAEKVILELKEGGKNGRRNDRGENIISTSQIRNILSMLAGMYNQVIHSKSNTLEQSLQGDLKYCKMRYVYEAGRDKKMKDFINKSRMMEYIDWIGDSRENFILYYHYIEALVAYHRYYCPEK